ncbi:hypothetical protein AB1L07_08470 [Niallia alba]|uniref:hypothetical protein n=1 Tax=Niallia alba TaxID=2729105 RepID=UPI002902E675|nr:hypothetical protein [Niallia nealsonii]MED3793052.1 hypothetical protein [Niallia alba]
MDYKQFWNSINQKNDEIITLYANYRAEYSDITSWQFWMIIFTLILPLVILIFTVDRRRIFELFFYGYTVHIMSTYIDMVLGRKNLLIHNYFIFSALPNAINITASVIPVVYLLLYQYCTNKGKNFYLYSVITGLLLTYGLTTFNEAIGLVTLSNGMTKFYIFLLGIVVTYLAYWFTRLMKKIENRL